MQREIKLAEYNLKTGKFKRFLKIDKDFLFGGRKIYLREDCQYCSMCSIEHDCFIGMVVIKDKKDPLNRFNGLFDGRTYGKGRFILIINDQDDIFKSICWKNTDLSDYFFLRGKEDYSPVGENLLKNIHENPELFGKLTL